MNDTRMTTQKVMTGIFKVLWDGQPTDYEIVNGCMGSSGHGANIYCIHNVKTDKVTVVGTLQSAKKGLAHTLRRRAQGGMPNPLDALARTEGLGVTA